MTYHVMVPAVVPNGGKWQFKMQPVNTGFLPDGGKELPFWHVMFEAPPVTAERG